MLWLNLYSKRIWNLLICIVNTWIFLLSSCLLLVIAIIEFCQGPYIFSALYLGVQWVIQEVFLLALHSEFFVWFGTFSFYFDRASDFYYFFNLWILNGPNLSRLNKTGKWNDPRGLTINEIAFWNDSIPELLLTKKNFLISTFVNLEFSCSQTEEKGFHRKKVFNNQTVYAMPFTKSQFFLTDRWRYIRVCMKAGRLIMIWMLFYFIHQNNRIIWIYLFTNWKEFCNEIISNTHLCLNCDSFNCHGGKLQI